MEHITVAVIGAGCVGSTIAYSLVTTLPVRVFLLDRDEKRCQGQVMDLADMVGWHSQGHIAVGTWSDARTADIIIIAAGAPQKPGQARHELWDTNHQVIEDIIQSLGSVSSDSIIIVVTNPVDMLTLRVQELTGLPRAHVFGSGTLLDARRLSRSIGLALGLSPEVVHIPVIGEHGEHHTIVWSAGTIAGIPALTYPGVTPQLQMRSAQDMQQAAFALIEYKGATQYGIAACVVQYCTAIVRDARSIVPVSTYVPAWRLCVSVPVILGMHGIERIIMPPLSVAEQAAWQAVGTALQERTGKTPPVSPR